MTRLLNVPARHKATNTYLLAEANVDHVLVVVVDDAANLDAFKEQAFGLTEDLFALLPAVCVVGNLETPSASKRSQKTRRVTPPTQNCIGHVFPRPKEPQDLPRGHQPPIHLDRAVSHASDARGAWVGKKVALKSLRDRFAEVRYVQGDTSHLVSRMLWKRGSRNSWRVLKGTLGSLNEVTSRVSLKMKPEAGMLPTLVLSAANAGLTARVWLRTAAAANEASATALALSPRRTKRAVLVGRGSLHAFGT